MDFKTEQLFDDLESWGAEPRQVIEETFMGDHSFYKEYLKKFSETNYLNEISESLVPEKMEIAIRTVHTMKGNSDYLGLFPITDAAVSVLCDLRNNQIEQASVDMIELEKALGNLLRLIKPYLS